jgi:hypothetical protein
MHSAPMKTRRALRRATRSSGAPTVDRVGCGVGRAVLKNKLACGLIGGLLIPYAAVKTEAAHLGISWPALSGIVFTTFADGHVVVVAKADATADAERLFEHLIDCGLTDPLSGPADDRVRPSQPAQ